MKLSIIRLECTLVLLALGLTTISCNRGNNEANSAAANSAPAGSTTSAPSDGLSLKEEELDELLAPIALYPDPLLAQIIPAATFVDEIKEAQKTLNGSSDDNLIAKQDWDISVKAVAHYPDVLKRMAAEEDWTTTLGQAYINQPVEVTKSLQRLRASARDTGNLVATKQQAVIIKDDIIRIEPAQPEVIYVPQYDPETVYVDEAPQYSEQDTQYVEGAPQQQGTSTGAVVAAGAITFAAGLAIGAWLNRDYDYYGDYGSGPYYHGWSGNGWINTNSTYVNANINRNIYVNDSYRTINTNRSVVNRNVNANYRNNLSRNATVRNQRTTNAGVQRQLKRQNGDLGGPNRGGDRNLGQPGRPDLGDRGQPRVNELDRGRGADPGGSRNEVGGGRQNLGDRGNPSSPNRGGGGQMQSSGGNRQKQAAAPRQQPQRSAPKSGGGGGGGGARRR